MFVSACVFKVIQKKNRTNKNLISDEWKSLDFAFGYLNCSMKWNHFLFECKKKVPCSVVWKMKQLNEIDVSWCAILCMAVWVFVCQIDNWKEFTDTLACNERCHQWYFVSSVFCFHSKILFILPGYCSFMKWFIRGTNVYIHWLSIVFYEKIQLKTRALN